MIIVTGGAGFIGSNILAELEKRGHKKLVVCDVFGTDQKWRNVSRRLIHDFVAPADLMTYIEMHGSDIEAIFHMGAISATTEKDVDAILDNNFHFTWNLWELCTQLGIRFYYASSAATYGDGDKGFKDDFDSKKLAQLNPLNPYGWSKHLIDRKIRATLDAGEPAPPQWAGFKFFNVYGPNEYHKEGMVSVAYQLYHQIHDKGMARLFESDRPDYGHGEQSRDFVWVGDCVDIMLWFFENPKVSGLFNVGTGKARSFKDLALATFAALDERPNIEFFPMPEQLRGKYQYFTEADMTNLRKAGYKKPMTSLEDGVKAYVNILSQEDPYL